MSCFICNKKYARLSSHLLNIHGVRGNTTEPKTIDQYAKYLELFSSPEAGLHYKYKKSINAYLNENKSLPSKVYRILERRLKEYKQNKGIKLVVKVAANKKHTRQSRSHISPQIKSDKLHSIDTNAVSPSVTIDLKRAIHKQIRRKKQDPTTLTNPIDIKDSTSKVQKRAVPKQVRIKKVLVPTSHTNSSAAPKSA